MRKLYSILCATLIGILFTTTAWADVMSSHDDTFGERLLNFDVSTTTLIVLSYIFFAFIAFWVLFPFYRKTKKKLLAISLIFPILVFVPPFIVWTNDYLHELWDNNYKLVIILLVPFFFLYALYALFAKKRKRLLIRLVYIFLYILFLVIFNYADEMVNKSIEEGYRLRREENIRKLEQECVESGGRWIIGPRRLTYCEFEAKDEAECEEKGGKWASHYFGQGCVKAD